MTSRSFRKGVYLARSWPASAKSAVLHAIALAHFALVHARGWAANSFNARVRQAAEIDRLRAEAAMLREEIRIKDARMAAILPARRPHYPPVLRMAILELKAVRAWSLARTANAFLVEPATIAAWLKRLDESGPESLVQMPAPVIAVIERFIRTFKAEGLRRIVLPLREKDLCREISLYVEWFNIHRPHTALGGRTPDERYRRVPAACRRPRFEPRPRWPRDSLCAEPQAKVKGQCGAKLELVVEFHGGHKHLPIVTLKRAA